MKKLLSILLLQMLVFAVAFGATINSKQGYFKLAWGSTVEDAKKAGYKLAPMDKDYSNKLYSVSVDAYKVTSKDKDVTALQFHYYKGSLFLVTETLAGYTLDPQKLAKRYGDFNQRGISRSGRQYTDAKFEDDGSVFSMSIAMATNSTGNVVTTMYDWNTYRFISFAGQRLANRGESLKTSLSSELERTAKELLKGLEYELSLKKEASQAKLAFYPLTTDYNNVYVENHITDTLSRVMLDIGRDKVEIYERAKVERLLEELHFQESAFINQDIENVKQTGKGIGVEYVCYGDLKDLGDRFTVNARIVNVESGKICAMSTDTIKKDDYLKQRKQGAEGERKSAVTSTAKTTTNTPTTTTTKTTASTPAVPAPAPTVPATPATSTPAKPATSVVSNAWKVTKYRNNFDGYTKYIFKVYSTDDRFVFISYKKCDVAANSRVIAGVHWGGGDFWNGARGIYDIKSKEGTVSKRFDDFWTEDLDGGGKDKFTFVWNQKEGSRTLTERFKNNEAVTLRRDDLVRRFQTAGLLDKMAEYGITWKEIDAAIANEEF